MRHFRIRKAALILTLALVLASFTLSGCLFDGPTKKTLLNYFGECTVKSARFYDSTEGGQDYPALDTARIPELVDKLNSMKLTTKSFHTDYFWGGQYGIELELEDGTYLTYDGTKLEHRNAPRPENDGNRIESVFAEVTNMKFWEEMEAFFPEVKESPYTGR